MEMIKDELNYETQDNDIEKSRKENKIRKVVLIIKKKKLGT
jgi:hypothetical protein